MKLFFSFSLLLLSINNFAQYNDEYISFSNIAGNPKRLVMKDEQNNYYLFDTKNDKAAAELIVKEKPRSASDNYFTSEYAANGNTIVQFQLRTDLTELTVIDVIKATSRLVKLSEKINIEYGVSISDDGERMFNINYDINLITGKVTKNAAIKNGYEIGRNSKGSIIAYYSYANKDVFINDASTGKTIKSLGKNYESALMVGKYIMLQQYNALSKNYMLKTYNINTGTYVNFLKTSLSIFDFLDLGNDRCRLKAETSSGKWETFIWDLATNTYFPISLSNNESKKGLVFGTEPNSFFYLTELDGHTVLRLLNYKTNTTIKQWIWGYKYATKYPSLVVKENLYTAVLDKQKAKSQFSNLANYTENEKALSNTVVDAKEGRKNLYKLPFVSTSSINEIIVHYADINGDGFKDAFLHYKTDNNIVLLVNNTQNQFSKVLELPKGENKSHTATAMLKDVDNDKLQELIVFDGDVTNPDKVNIYSFKNGINNIKCYTLKKDAHYNFSQYLGVTKQHTNSNAFTADFDKNGRKDEVRIMSGSGFKGISIFEVPALTNEAQRQTGFSVLKDDYFGKKYFSVQLPETPSSVFVNDFDKDGNDDFFVSTVFKTYVFFNKGNGKSFEVKTINNPLDNIELLAEKNSTGAFIANDDKAIYSVSFDKQRNINVTPLFKNTAKAGVFLYDAFEDLNNDGIKEYIDFAQVIDNRTEVHEFSVTVYNGKASNQSVYYEGLVVDEQKERDDELVAWKKKQREIEEKRKKDEETKTTTKTSTTDTKTKTTTVPEEKKNLVKGVAYYKGVSKSGLVIELSANVLYETVKPKGMLGMKFKEVYKAECLYFRYPNTSNKWFNVSGSDCLYRCTDKSIYTCVSIQGMEFVLAEPTIYAN